MFHALVCGREGAGLENILAGPGCAVIHVISCFRFCRPWATTSLDSCDPKSGILLFIAPAQKLSIPQWRYARADARRRRGCPAKIRFEAEIRNSKSEIRKKSEVRNPKSEARKLPLGGVTLRHFFWPPPPTDFGQRISEFFRDSGIRSSGSISLRLLCLFVADGTAVSRFTSAA